MNFDIRAKWAMSYLRNKKNMPSQQLENITRWTDADRVVEISVDELGWDVVEKILDISSKDEGIDSLALKFKRKFTSVQKLKANPSGAKINKLMNAPEALRAYMDKSPNKWLFSEQKDDGSIMPYFVERADYHPPTKRSEAYVSVSLRYVYRGESKEKSITFGSYHAIGRTIPELLQKWGYFLENEDMVESYHKSANRYVEIRGKTGAQFLASGFGYSQGASRYSSRCVTSMVRDGSPTKVVMDDLDDESDDGDKRSDTATEGSFPSRMSFWSKNGKETTDDDDDDEITEEQREKLIEKQLPRHPYVQVFDLQNHSFCVINTDFLEEYPYNTELASKLVLPEEKRRLIDILVGSSEVMMDDIVKGKSGGIIVLASGPSGVGKTLSAEVFSEGVKRPLYNVQCSQLGTNESLLEGSLKKVLRRSIRWNAILLLDECDVYVHDRGQDINQNAIVGVFLRTLEYYNGIMFMTTNRATIVDDAIMSRVTAWIKYEMPSPEELFSVWKILSANYKVEITDNEITKIVEAMPNLSGRNVKNILKLAKLYSKKMDGKITVNSLRYVAKYLDIDEKTNKTADVMDF